MGKPTMNSKTGKAGLIRAPDDADGMDKLANSILDDLLYNIISDIAMKTHREEKVAKAASAAIQIEKLASDASEGSTPDSRPDVEVETEAAIYKDGTVLLKGNPLQTTKEILCPKCHLPRLLHPTDGKGGQQPDPTVVYCKKYPYIQKPGCDIYGQSWVAPGPGRGKKKKDQEKKDGVDASTKAEQRPPNVLSFPSATCSKCKRCVLISRLNNHMGSCIGNSGRNASRAAAQKLSNGNSQGDNTTPPSSQKPTPGPGSRAASPKKREAAASDDDDENESEASHKKKKAKGTPAAGTPGSATTKKVILKTRPNLKKESSKPSSQLSQEQKMDDYDVPADPSIVVAAPAKPSPKPSPKPTPKMNSPAKKLKTGKPTLNSPLSKSKDLDADKPTTTVLSSPTATR